MFHNTINDAHLDLLDQEISEHERPGDDGNTVHLTWPAAPCGESNKLVPSPTFMSSSRSVRLCCPGRVDRYARLILIRFYYNSIGNLFMIRL